MFSSANKDLPQREQPIDFSNTNFKIRHFSARIISYNKNEYMPARDVYFVNVIVDAPKNSSSEDAFIYYAKEYVKARVAKSIEEIFEYYDSARSTLYDNLEGNEKGNKLLAEYFTEGYNSNPLQILEYNKKFNVFRYSQYIEKVPVTTAAIESLQYMQKTGEGFSKSSATYYEFLNLIQTLDMFWD